MWQLFLITKREQNGLQNTAASLLQNASMLLQNVASITKCINFITERGRYYKTRQLLQNTP